jgi:hypothetical protein
VVSKERFVEGLAVANMVPGATATQLAIFLAYERGGWWGGLLGGLCFVLPGFVIMLARAITYAGLGFTLIARGALYGLGPVVIGLFAVALYRLGRSAASTKSEMSIAVIAAIISATTPLGIAALVLAGGRPTAPLSSSNTADHGRRIDHLGHDPFDIVVAHNCGPDGWTGYNPGSTEPGGARGVLPEGGSLHHRRRPDDDRVHPGAGRRSVSLANAA